MNIENEEQYKMSIRILEPLFDAIAEYESKHYPIPIDSKEGFKECKHGNVCPCKECYEYNKKQKQAPDKIPISEAQVINMLELVLQEKAYIPIAKNILKKEGYIQKGGE